MTEMIAKYAIGLTFGSGRVWTISKDKVNESRKRVISAVSTLREPCGTGFRVMALPLANHRRQTASARSTVST